MTDGNPPSRSYYFIGKDNIPFHTIIWPAMLIGYGGLNLPYDVPANEFMTMGGSRSLDQPRHRHLDCATCSTATAPTRCATTSPATCPKARDTDFSCDELVRRNNDELVAT